jgi:hypothetical protein
VIQPSGACGPSNSSLKIVIAPVNSSAWADTSGRVRHGVADVAPAIVAWQNPAGNPDFVSTSFAFV